MTKQKTRPAAGLAAGGRAYKTLLETLKKERGGLTAADMSAKSALPLNEVRELIPAAADEYRARLEVTESGEILYSFPNGWTSRYRGIGPSFRRFAEKFLGAAKIFLKTAFKVWITVMLAGYFILFILIVLAALLFVMAASASGNNKNSSRRDSSGGLGGAFLFSRMLDTIFRFWFYSSLFGGNYGADNRRYRNEKARGEKPLYKKVFSFVFGDGDPNAGWESRETREIIGFLQSHKGVISLPEFMILTGLSPARADGEILAFCARYGGMPEATEEGTVVYRFDPLLLAADAARKSAGKGWAVSLKKLWPFSSNKASSNAAYAVINGINLAFGSYFLFFMLNLEKLLAGTVMSGSFLFRFVYISLVRLGIDPAPTISIGLGAVPFLFSLLFWLVPALRGLGLKKKNALVLAENGRKTALAAVWDRPLEVTEEGLPREGADADKASAHKTAAFIKEIGGYSVPDVSVDESGRTIYSFTGLAEEKKALETYRAAVDMDKNKLGGVVFDSGT